MSFRTSSTEKTIKIVHLINDLSYAGAQRVVLSLAQTIDSEQFETLIVVWGAPTDLKVEFDKIGVRVVDLKASGALDIRSVAKLYWFLRNTHVDILHTHLFRMHILGRLVGRLAGVRAVVTTHHNMLHSNHVFTRFLERLTRPLSDITTVVSCSAEKSYFSSSQLFSVKQLQQGQRHFTIYNGIDIHDVDKRRKEAAAQIKRAELGIRDEFVIACVARFHPCKGHIHLINALERLRSTNKPIRLLLLGEGPLRPELTEAIHALKLDASVSFLGIREDVIEVLAACDLLVLPSLYEGFGMALIEAMASSLPVIATDLPTIREIVVDNQTGLLVPPGDSYRLAEAISVIQNDRNLAASYGEKGRSRVEALFSLKDISLQYESLYQAL